MVTNKLIQLSRVLVAVLSLATVAKPALAATYYWDNNGSTTGFGTAGGTWAAPTTGNSTQGWSTSSAGTSAPGDVTTLGTNTTTDALNFGTASAGLAAGTITVSGTVNSGSMTFGSASSPVTISGGTVTFASNAVITFNKASSTGNVAMSSNITGAGNLSFFHAGNVAGSYTTTLGPISNSGSVTFGLSGGGSNNPSTVFNLNGASSYTGTTSFSSGTNVGVRLVLGVDDGLAPTTVLDFGTTVGVASGREYSLNLNGSNQTLGGVTGTASSMRLMRVQNTSGTASTLSINDNSNRSFTGILGSTSLSGSISLATGNNFGVVKNGTGTWTLNGQISGNVTNNLAAPNSYTGGTILNQGGITLGAGATLGTGSLQVNNTNTGAGTNVVLTLPTGSDLTVGSLSGTIATPTSGTNTASIVTQTGRTFTVNQTTNGTYAGAITGDGSFVLGGNSTAILTLAGTNSYNGSTTVSAGTLLVTGSLSTAGGLVVAPGATFSSTGTITGNMAFDLTSILNVENLSPSSLTPFDVSGGTVSFAAGTPGSRFGIDNLSGINWETLDTGNYTLITGTVDGTNLDNLGVGNATSVGFGKTAYFEIGSLQLIVVPEPSTLMMATLGVVGFGYAARRRRG